MKPESPSYKKQPAGNQLHFHAVLCTLHNSFIAAVMIGKNNIVVTATLKICDLEKHRRVLHRFLEPQSRAAAERRRGQNAAKSREGVGFRTNI
ncbi:hypothetical protein L596_022927 [Steinernema carpocapsae]|uniref:Uncharacterized protein n=1 Tax=Steinernema carpocapsae TaxID=34508 RepID=A0A4U5MC07_STECR|nr:hypothetical protein L596_022927 [Steinernema carpocapsae]